MKMGPAIFFGIVLVIIGISMIFKFVFDVSLFRVIFGIFVIFIGIKIIFGPRLFIHSKNQNDTFFEEKEYHNVNGEKTEYNVIFGKSVYDFSKLDLSDKKTRKTKINVVFGNAKIKLNSATRYLIKSETVFGTTKLPNGSTIHFGDSKYSNTERDSANLVIHTAVVFGDLEVYQK